MIMRNIIITIITNVTTIIVCIFLLQQIDLNRNDWEKAKSLNLTNYLGGDDITYNITNVIENNQKLCDSLQKLKQTLFFKIFKINLDPECSVFHQEMICKDTACQICECSNTEVPRVWKQPSGIDENVVTTIDDPFNKWVEKFNVDSKQWLLKEDIDPKDGSYVNLLKNPEGYTGYRGAHIWNAIFKENCYTESYSSLCVEDKIFSNIFMGWLVNTNFQIGCNFRNRQTNESYVNISYVTNKFLYHKDKIDYLFFLYSLMLKAVNKAVPFLLNYDYSSGNKTEDKMTLKIIKEIFRYELLNMDLIEDSFQDTYAYFDNFISSNRLAELIIRFRNISSIIDCVTCSKCRMHAKLEVFGIATMLKILFAPNTEELKKSMSRNELVSFINLFAKLSKSVSNIEKINTGIIEAHHNFKMKKFKCISYVGIVGVIITLMILNFVNSDKDNENDNDDDINNYKDKNESMRNNYNKNQGNNKHNKKIIKKKVE
jgi:ERO1-like protein alpha